MTMMHSHKWKYTTETEAEKQCQVCGAIQSWSPKETAWTWDIMPFEEFGLNLLRTSKEEKTNDRH